MTKIPVPLHVEDTTAFARALARQLGEASPSHLTLMNIVARSAGYQNLQHMRAACAASRRLEKPDAETLADARSVERCLHQFDAAGRLRQWPSKRSVQTLALWGLWATLPARQEMSERALSAHLGGEHLFADAATLRRTMVSCGLLSRNPDGSAYLRIEQRPTPEAKAVINALSTRRNGRAEDVKQHAT